MKEFVRIFFYVSETRFSSSGIPLEYEIITTIRIFSTEVFTESSVLQLFF